MRVSILTAGYPFLAKCSMICWSLSAIIVLTSFLKTSEYLYACCQQDAHRPTHCHARCAITSTAEQLDHITHSQHIHYQCVHKITGWTIRCDVTTRGHYPGKQGDLSRRSRRNVHEWHRGINQSINQSESF